MYQLLFFSRAFQSEMSALLALGAPVVGVSSDTNSDNSGHWSHSTEEIDCFSISMKVLSSPSTVSHWLLVHGFIPFGILVAYLCTSLEMSKQYDINERLTKDHHEAYCLHFHFKWQGLAKIITLNYIILKIHYLKIKINYS